MNNQNTTQNEVVSKSLNESLQSGQATTQILPQEKQNPNPVAFQEPSILSRVFTKFYSNKLIFWPVTSFMVIVLLIIILGLLFGKKGVQNTPVIKPSTVPFILPTPNATPGLEVLSTSEQKIKLLKTQIEEMDIRQNRLKPPIINFEIKF